MYVSIQLCSLAILSKIDPSDCTRLNTFLIRCPNFRELHKDLFKVNSARTMPKDQMSTLGFGNVSVIPSKYTSGAV